MPLSRETVEAPGTTQRFRFAPDVLPFIDELLGDTKPTHSRTLAQKLDASGFELCVTRHLEAAKTFLRNRFGKAPRARYGLIASSQDRLLPKFDVDNTAPAADPLRVVRAPLETGSQFARMSTVPC